MDMAVANKGRLITCLVSVDKEFNVRFATYYKKILNCFLILMFCWTIAHLNSTCKHWGYIVGEWLINYGAGFARRGLGGEIIIFLSRLSGMQANMVIFALCAIITTSLFILFARLLRHKTLSFWYVYLCFSPLAFRFFWKGNGRKELLFEMVFFIWVAFIKRNAVTLRLSWVLASMVFFITLIHEGTVFYTVYFIFALFLSNGSFVASLKKAWMIPAASVMAIVLIMLFGVSLSNPALCQRLYSVGITQVCASQFALPGIAYFPQTMMGTFYLTSSTMISTFTRLTPVNLLSFIVVAIFPLYGFLYTHSKSARLFRSYLWFQIALCLCTVPLFLMGYDWGRWLSIHMVMILASFSLLLPDQSVSMIGHRVSCQFEHKSKVNIGIGLMMIFLSFMTYLKVYPADFVGIFPNRLLVYFGLNVPLGFSLGS